MTTGTIDASWYEKPPDVDEHCCAGGLVARREGERILIALGGQTGYATRIIPKGHVENDEDIEAAARREIEEEAGFTDLRLLDKLGVRDRLDYHKEAWKRTHYFLFLTRQREAQPTHDERHPPPTWHELDDIPPLFWPEQQALIDENRERIRAAVLAAGEE